MKIKTLIIVIWLVSLSTHGIASPAPADIKVDHSSFAKLLKQFVIDCSVDYNGFKSDKMELDAYLSMLSEIDPTRLCMPMDHSKTN
jgi:hypothetical protein